MVLLAEYYYGEFHRYLSVAIETPQELHSILENKPEDVDTKEYLEDKGYKCTELKGRVEYDPVDGPVLDTDTLQDLE